MSTESVFKPFLTFLYNLHYTNAIFFHILVQQELALRITCTVLLFAW